MFLLVDEIYHSLRTYLKSYMVYQLIGGNTNTGNLTYCFPTTFKLQKNVRELKSCKQRQRHHSRLSN